MANIGYATLSVIPSFKGMDAKLRAGIGKTFSGVNSDAEKAGADVGDSFTKGLSSKTKALGLLAVAGVAAAGVAFTGLAVQGVTAFTGFERSMNEVFTLLPGISEQAMGQMTDQVKSFSKEFGVLPETVVPALYQALSAGVPQGNVFDFLETAQKAAKGGVTDLTTAVDGLSSVVNAYGPEALSAQQASDLMFTTVRLGKTTMEELSQSLFNVTPTAAALGVTFSDVTAALAAMTAQGIPTSVATTQLRQLFVELSKEGTATSAVFEKVAGKSFKDFIASGKNTQDALQLLEQYASKTGVGINDLFGSVEAGSAALALTGQGTDKFSASLAGMQDSAGATDAAFQQMDKGLGPVIDKLKAWAQVMLIEIGEKIAPVIETVVAGAQAMIFAFNNPDLIASDGGVIGVFERIGTAARGVWDVVFPILSEIVGGFRAMVAAFVDGGNSITSSGFAGYMEGVGVVLRDVWDAAWQVGSVLRDILGGAITFVSDHFDGFKLAVATVVGALLAYKAIVTGIKLAQIAWTVATTAWTIVTNAGTIAQWALNAALSANPIGLVVAALAALAAAVVWAYQNVDWFRAGVDAAWDGIQAAISFAWNNVIKPIWDAIYQAIQNYLIPVIQAYWEVYKAIWAGIVAVVTWAWNTVIKPIWDAIYGFVQDWLIPGFQQWWAVMQEVWNGVVAVVQWAWNEVIFPVFNGIWTWIQNNLIPAMQWLNDKAQAVWNGIATAVQWAWDNVLQPVWSAISGFITDNLTPIFNSWWQTMQTIWSGVSSVISGAWNSVISPTFEAIKSGIGFLIGAFNTIREGISSALSTVYEVIVSPFRSAFNAIANLWNSTLGGFSFSTPDVPGTDWGGIDITIPNMPTFHQGGIVPGRPGQDVLSVLQAGEVVLSRAQVAEAAAARRSGGMGGRGDVIFEAGSVLYPAASAREIGDELAWRVRVGA